MEKPVVVQVHHQRVAGHLTEGKELLPFTSLVHMHRLDSDDETAGDLNSEQHGGGQQGNEGPSVLPRKEQAFEDVRRGRDERRVGGVQQHLALQQECLKHRDDMPWRE